MAVKRDTPTDKVYEKVDQEEPDQPALDYIEQKRTATIIPKRNPAFDAMLEQKRIGDETDGA